MSNFNVGDRVKYGNNIGKVATVNDSGSTGVDFEPDYPGHNLNGVIKTNTGWFCSDNLLTLAEPIKRPDIDKLIGFGS